MKATYRTSIIFAFIVILFSVLAGCSRGDRLLCRPNPPSFKDGEAGYEIINLIGREVWGTGNWTPESFAEFSLPLFWVFWQKNDPRIPSADDGRFLKSPGCAEGQYSYMRAFDREFLQVVRLISVNNRLDDKGLIRKTELEKYHILHYSAGRTVSILLSPGGEQFIGVSRSLDRSSDLPTLPEGWILKDHHLIADMQVDLLGTVSVLRLDNKDSYQGPLSENIRF